MHEAVAATGNENDQNPNENGMLVQAFHLVSTARMGPLAIPKPIKTASTGIDGHNAIAVRVLTAAGAISIPIVALIGSGSGPLNK
jgi:hypothetical protein